jgi:hypothetical protein
MECFTGDCRTRLCQNVTKELKSSVIFEVFTAVTMKNAVFWDVVPCRYSINRHFRGTYRLHVQGRTKKKEKSASEELA